MTTDTNNTINQSEFALEANACDCHQAPELVCHNCFGFTSD